jgi:hypothetical protein
MTMFEGWAAAMAMAAITMLTVEHYAARMKLGLKAVALKTRKVFEETDG